MTQQEGLPIDPDERTRRFAAAMLRASRRQLAVSLALTGAIALALAALDAPAKAFLPTAGIGVLLVGVHTYRILRTKAELREPSPDGGLLRSQRRSHLVRGSVFLVAGPILVLYVLARTWRAQPPARTGEWLATLGVVVVLGAGWVWWIRALRDVRRWPR